MGEDVTKVSPTLGFIIKTIDYEGFVCIPFRSLPTLLLLPYCLHLHVSLPLLNHSNLVSVTSYKLNICTKPKSSPNSPNQTR